MVLLLRGMDPELNSAAKSGEAATDERVGLFTPDKDGDTADGAGCVPVLAARRGTVCGEVGRVLRFPQLTVLSYFVRAQMTKMRLCKAAHCEMELALAPHENAWAL